jgi:hypothetical protein
MLMSQFPRLLHLLILSLLLQQPLLLIKFLRLLHLLILFLLLRRP